MKTTIVGSFEISRLSDCFDGTPHRVRAVNLVTLATGYAPTIEEAVAASLQIDAEKAEVIAQYQPKLAGV